jgi:hypothetical protein
MRFACWVTKATDRGTGLLDLCCVECLGLHNKPKAKGHQVHLLSGPTEEEEGYRHTLKNIINIVFHFKNG